VYRNFKRYFATVLGGRGYEGPDASLPPPHNTIIFLDNLLKAEI